ncbi:hypothetical protein ABZ894_10620 [Nocardia beijingensis]|uniref:hypothetical protein n=1 Tax=Nocardia beijingensis TaxID=95162 RepID=UPI0033F6FC10
MTKTKVIAAVSAAACVPLIAFGSGAASASPDGAPVPAPPAAVDVSQHGQVQTNDAFLFWAPFFWPVCFFPPFIFFFPVCIA